MFYDVHRLIGTLCLGALLVTVPRGTYRGPVDPKAPDFRAYPAGEARKEAFFEYLAPLIDAENELWRARRARLEGLRDRTLNKADRRWLKALAGFFEVSPDLPKNRLIDALLDHVDTVPRSLALAQAAKESAWGTSRFTREGNNYFGQRCYEKGCGMIPRHRPSGAIYEVRRFDSAEDSVASYLYNINSHLEYANLRDYRSRQRDSGREVSGIRAAETITQYSERRQAYVDEIQSLIHFNDLDDVDEPVEPEPSAY
ncbi:MAG: glucosaminidase domain-containing protein [Pseudomonadales bacterium]|jgi:Bax protein